MLYPDQSQYIRLCYKQSPKSADFKWLEPMTAGNYFLKKKISVKIWYKTHNPKLLAIFEIFKIWEQYLEDSKHKVLIPTNHNNFYQFMDAKSLSFTQVCWA